jgi:high-affinity iron transporter
VAATFFITLREGLEAALIVGIIAAYLVRIGRRDALRSIAVGVLLAIALSVISGAIVVATVGSLPSLVQDGIEGLAGVLAAVVLTWMLFWMRRQGRALKGDLEHDLERALVRGSMLALGGLAFVAVVREGLETTLFLLAIASSTTVSPFTLLAGLAGLGAATVVGLAIFAGGVRVNLRQFFQLTGVVLVFVCAGLLAFSVHAFGEAGLIPNGGTALDLSGVLPITGPVGTVLGGLFGYRDTPTPLELAVWLAYLVPVLVLFVASGRQQVRRPVPA